MKNFLLMLIISYTLVSYGAQLNISDQVLSEKTQETILCAIKKTEFDSATRICSVQMQRGDLPGAFVDENSILHIVAPHSFDKLSPKQQEAAIFHEMWHHKANHIAVYRRSKLVTNGILVAASALLYAYNKAYVRNLMGCFALNYLYHCFILRPRQEFEADQFAVIQQKTAKHMLFWRKLEMNQEEYWNMVDERLRNSNGTQTMPIRARLAQCDDKARQNILTDCGAELAALNRWYKKPTSVAEWIKKIPDYIRDIYTTGHAPQWLEREQIIKYAKKHNIPLDKE